MQIAQKWSRVNSILLPNSFFQVTVNNTNAGRTSKHSEYWYAKKSRFPIKISDCIWQHQTYAWPEIYVVW